MPWGKHKGLDLCQVPAGYLAWALEECDLNPWLRQAIARELVNRLGLEIAPPRPPPPPPPRSVPPDCWPDLLRRWHREMALQFHPDRGGSHEACRALNAAHDRLQELTTRAVAGDEDDEDDEDW
jgi:hypothetical protein